MQHINHLVDIAIQEASVEELLDATDEAGKTLNPWITDGSVVYRPDIVSVDKKKRVRGRSKKRSLKGKAEDESIFSDALDSVDDSHMSNPLVFKFKIDPVKYAHRFGVDIPDDSSDLSVTEDCGCKNKINGIAQDATISYINGAQAWQRQCQATLEECRARNPMTCRFHGTQVIARDIENCLRAAGVQGDVSVKFSGLTKSGGRQLLTVEARVNCPASQREAVQNAMNQFFQSAGVSRDDASPIETNSEGNGSIFDIDMLNPSARARTDWGNWEEEQPNAHQNAAPFQASAEQQPVQQPESQRQETTIQPGQHEEVERQEDAVTDINDAVQKALETATANGGFASAASLRDAINGAINGNAEDLGYLRRKIGENHPVLTWIDSQRNAAAMDLPTNSNVESSQEPTASSQAESQEPAAQQHPAEPTIPQDLLDAQTQAEEAVRNAQAQLEVLQRMMSYAESNLEGAPEGARDAVQAIINTGRAQVTAAQENLNARQRELDDANQAVENERQRQIQAHLPIYPAQYVDADGNSHAIEHRDGGIKATVSDSELAAVERMKAKAFADAANEVEGAEEYAHALSRFLGRGTENAPGLRSRPEKYRLLEKMESRLNEKNSAVENAERDYGRESEEFKDALADFKATQQAVRDIAGVLNVRADDCVGDNSEMTRAAIETMTQPSTQTRAAETAQAEPSVSQAPAAQISDNGNTVEVPDTPADTHIGVTQDTIQRHTGGQATQIQDNRDNGGDIVFTLPRAMSENEVNDVVRRLQEQYGEGFIVTASRNPDGSNSVQMVPHVSTENAEHLYHGLSHAGVNLGGARINSAGDNFTLSRHSAWDEATIRAIQRQMPDHDVRQEQNANGDWVVRISPRVRSQAEQSVNNALQDAVRQHQESLVGEGTVSSHSQQRAEGDTGTNTGTNTNATQVRAQDIQAHVDSALSRLVGHWGGYSDRILRGLNDALNGHPNADVDNYLAEAAEVLGSNNPVVQAINNRLHGQAEPAPAVQRTVESSASAPAPTPTPTAHTAQLEAERSRQLQTSNMSVGQQATMANEIEQETGVSEEQAREQSARNSDNMMRANPEYPINIGHIHDAIVLKSNLESEARRLRESGNEDAAVINENAARAISTFARRDGGMAQRGDDGQLNQTNRSVINHMVSYLNRARSRAAERHGNDPVAIRNARGVKGVEQAINSMGSALGFTPSFTDTGVKFDWGDGSSTTLNFDQVAEWRPSQRQPRRPRQPANNGGVQNVTPVTEAVSPQQPTATAPTQATAPSSANAPVQQNTSAAQRLEQAMTNVRTPAARTILERIRNRAQGNR